MRDITGPMLVLLMVAFTIAVWVLFAIGLGLLYLAMYCLYIAPVWVLVCLPIVLLALGILWWLYWR